MESIRAENLSFCYPKREKKALYNINLTINQGEFVLVCGKSGCGKTTLMRLLKPSLSPFGEADGDVIFEGKPLSYYDAKSEASKIGFVMQNPDNQIVCDKVWHELAFGLESLGYSNGEIRTRVSEMASFFGIQNWFYKNVTELSGGQKQLLNLASVMVMQPSLLILDEPTSQLDPISAGEFLNTLQKINRELGTTVILSEHRLEEAFALCDRVVVMDEGSIVADDIPRNIGEILKNINHPMYISLPTPMRVCGAVENNPACPVTVREGRVWLEEYSKENTLDFDAIKKDSLCEFDENIVEIKDAHFRYKKDLPDVIKGLNVSVRKGEIYAILGGNGSGKSTLLSLISGLNSPYRGDVIINGQNISKIKGLYRGVLGVLPQDPYSMFVKKTVYLDLKDMMSENKISDEEKERKIHNVSKLCKIEDLLEFHPYDLSGGEVQRVALAKVLLTKPEILLLDEPTKGMDAHFKEEFASILCDLKDNGTTVIMVSHDIEFCAEYADRCALVFDGMITSEGTPREFFKGKNFYTTCANRMARTTIPDAILAEDIILACGGNVQKREIKTEKYEIPKQKNDDEPSKEKKKVTVKKSKGSLKRTLMSLFLILILIPFTIYVGVEFFGDRKYYFISVLIILETMFPFIMAFETRKPQARELIIISVLCAIAVAGRTAFYMLPQFKPVVAIVIISGICFGGETGFLVGVVTGFVSNFFFGQGPWTPWQMFAFGIIGFIAGIVFGKGCLRKNRLTLSIFGFLTTFIIYGGIMNPASVIMAQGKITWEMIVTACAMGFQFDLVHGISSAFFLWFISEPMIEKLERVKVKYGIAECS